jgi:aminoglycoside phosphotransferase (APT) family kinase protein
MSRTDPRPTWGELPADVRAGVERLLGDTVIDAVTQPGGYSPGSADRVLLASGRRAFIKAASAETNHVTVKLHRDEAAITAALPAQVPAPKLLGMYDDGTWVALVLSDVVGVHPREPWLAQDLAAVLDALADMAPITVPAGVALPRYETALSGDFKGWERLIADPSDTLRPWAAARLELLAEMAARGTAASAGNSLVHGDLRADSILLTASGPVLIDWPWACVGALWVDALGVLASAKTYDHAFDAESWLAGHRIFTAVPDSDVNDVLAGLAGYFADVSRRPASPGMPSLRAFQALQGDAVLTWLARRLA